MEILFYFLGGFVIGELFTMIILAFMKGASTEDKEDEHE